MLSVCDWIWNSRQGKAPLAPSIEAQQMLGIIGLSTMSNVNTMRSVGKLNSNYKARVSFGFDLNN